MISAGTHEIMLRGKGAQSTESTVFTNVRSILVPFEPIFVERLRRDLY